MGGKIVVAGALGLVGRLDQGSGLTGDVSVGAQ